MTFLHSLKGALGIRAHNPVTVPLLGHFNCTKGEPLPRP